MEKLTILELLEQIRALKEYQKEVVDAVLSAEKYGRNYVFLSYADREAVDWMEQQGLEVEYIKKIDQYLVTW